MQELISALERTVELLEESGDSIWAQPSVDDAKEILKTQLNNLKNTEKFDFLIKEIKFLFLPTGALQEISASNDWDEEFLSIARIVDEYTS